MYFNLGYNFVLKSNFSYSAIISNLHCLTDSLVEEDPFALANRQPQNNNDVSQKAL